MRFWESDFWVGYATALFAWLSSFMVPITPFISLVVFLVFSDLLTGLRAARKRGDKITSQGLRRTIEKIILYSVALLSSEGMRQVFVPDIPITYMSGLAIAMTEFQSIIENIEDVTGVKIWTTLKDVIKVPLNKKK